MVGQSYKQEAKTRKNPTRALPQTAALGQERSLARGPSGPPAEGRTYAALPPALSGLGLGELPLTRAGETKHVPPGRLPRRVGLGELRTAASR